MYDKFQRNFSRDSWQYGSKETPFVLPEVPLVGQFLEKFGGASFRNGLYRIIHPAHLTEWQDRVHLAFPEFEGRVICFGFDWLGRVFALDLKRQESGNAGVIMFEPGTGEALEIPSNLRTFHENELIDFGEAALAISFHEKWTSVGGVPPKFDQCIGYKMPLFFGGADEVENLEVSDIDVYWHIMGQLILKTKDLPQGTSVNVTIDE